MSRRPGIQETTFGEEAFEGKVIESQNGGIVQLLDEVEYAQVFEDTTSNESPSIGITACGHIKNVKVNKKNYCFETSERELIEKTHFIEEGMNEIIMLLLAGKRVVLTKTSVEGKHAVKFVIKKAPGKDLSRLSEELKLEIDPASKLELLQVAVVTTLQTIKNAAENGISLQDVQLRQMVGFDRAAAWNGEGLKIRRNKDPNLPRFSIEWIDFSTTKYCGFSRDMLEGSISSLEHLSNESLQVPDLRKVENFNKSIVRLEEILTKLNPDDNDIEDMRLVFCNLEGSYWGSLILNKLEEEIGSSQMSQLRKIAEMAAKPSLINKLWQGITGQVDTDLWRMVIPKAKESVEIFKKVSDDFSQKIKKPPFEVVVNRVIARIVEDALAQFPDMDQDWDSLLDEASQATKDNSIPYINVDEEFDIKALRNVRTYKPRDIKNAIDRIMSIGKRRNYYLLFNMLEELRMIGPQFVNGMTKQIMEQEHYNDDGVFHTKARQVQGYLEEIIRTFPNLDGTKVGDTLGANFGANDVENVLSKIGSVITRIEADRISMNK